MTGPADQIISIYQRHFRKFDKERGRGLFEKIWLDRMTALMPNGADVLDLGCGMGEPVAEYLIDQSFRITGVDTSAGMLDLCRQRFPDHAWIERDMRGLDLDRRFGGILAFNSFFHLTREDQRAMFPVFARHAREGAPLLFTTGPTDGEAIGDMAGEPLFHASLAPDEYKLLLDQNGFDLLHCVLEDSDCNGHCVWLAKRRYDPGR